MADKSSNYSDKGERATNETGERAGKGTMSPAMPTMTPKEAPKAEGYTKYSDK